MKEEKYYRAMRVFSRLSRLRPYVVEYHWQLARCCLKLGDYQGANDAYLKAIKLIGMRPDILKEYALMWYKAGEYRKSFFWYNYAEKKAPWDTQIPEAKKLLKLERGLSFTVKTLPYYSVSSSFYGDVFYGGLEDIDLCLSYYNVEFVNYFYRSLDFSISRRFWFKYQPYLLICRRGLKFNDTLHSFWVIGGDFSVYYIRSLDYFFSFYRVDTLNFLQFGAGFRSPKIYNIGRFNIQGLLKYKQKICLPVFRIYYYYNDSSGLKVVLDYAENNDFMLARNFKVIPWYSALLFKKRFLFSIPFGFYEFERTKKNYWNFGLNVKFYLFRYHFLMDAGFVYFFSLKRFIFNVSLTLRSGIGFGMKKFKEPVHIVR